MGFFDTIKDALTGGLKTLVGVDLGTSAQREAARHQERLASGGISQPAVSPLVGAGLGGAAGLLGDPTGVASGFGLAGALTQEGTTDRWRQQPYPATLPGIQPGRQSIGVRAITVPAWRWPDTYPSAGLYYFARLAVAVASPLPIEAYRDVVKPIPYKMRMQMAADIESTAGTELEKSVVALWNKRGISSRDVIRVLEARLVMLLRMWKPRKKRRGPVPKTVLKFFATLRAYETIRRRMARMAGPPAVRRRR